MGMSNDQRWRSISADGQTVTLKRFDGKIHVPAFATPEWLRQHSAELAEGAALDVETTGLSHDRSEVIEVGIRRFRFHRETGAIVEIGEGFVALQEPSAPLSHEIQDLTGITPEILRGQSIDWDRVNAILEPCEIIVAHNARFDRPFIDQKTKISSSKLWGCSYAHVDWAEKGYPVSKLEILAAYHGFFYGAHRALEDADVLTHLLNQPDAASGGPYFGELWRSARKPFIEILGFGAPFESKDLLKVRGYRWDNIQRVWKKTLCVEERSEEVQWLETSVYAGPFRGRVREISPESQFRVE